MRLGFLLCCLLFTGFPVTGALAQEADHVPVPCTVAEAAPPLMRTVVINYVKGHDTLTLSFEEDACASANQVMEIINRTLKGDYFKEAQGFELFTLTDESGEFNTFLLVRFLFNAPQPATTLANAIQKLPVPRMAVEAPLQLDCLASGNEAVLLLSPPFYFMKNRDVFRELQQNLVGATPMPVR